MVDFEAVRPEFPRPPPLFDSKFCEIVPKLFLGSMMAARNEERLRALGITHILTITKLAKTPEFPELFTYLVLEEDDTESSDLLTKLPILLLFIEEGLQSGGVFVHCAIGVSRSASVCVAYLMSALSMTREEALAQVRKARPQADPNRGFLRQLAVFEALGAPRVFSAREAARARLAHVAAERAAGGGVSVFRAQPSVVTLHRPGHARPLRITGEPKAAAPAPAASPPPADGAGDDARTAPLRAAGAASVGEEEAGRVAQAGRAAAYVGAGLACAACRRPLLRSLNLLPHPHPSRGEAAAAACEAGADESCAPLVWRAVLTEAARRGSGAFEAAPERTVLFVGPDGAAHERREAGGHSHSDEPPPSPQTAPPPLPPDLAGRPPSRCACAVVAAAESTPACDVHFTEPLWWMGDVSADEGEIRCVGCRAAIGAWRWGGGGLECRCGGRLTPAFAICRDAVVVEAAL